VDNFNGPSGLLAAVSVYDTVVSHIALAVHSTVHCYQYLNSYCDWHFCFPDFIGHFKAPVDDPR